MKASKTAKWLVLFASIAITQSPLPAASYSATTIECRYPILDGTKVLFRKTYFEISEDTNKYYKLDETWTLGQNWRRTSLTKSTLEKDRDAYILVLLDTKTGFSYHIDRKHLSLQIWDGYRGSIIGKDVRLVFEAQCSISSFPSRNKL